MSQHFLLSAKARTLSLAQVMRLSDAEAYETFKAIRWADNAGKPSCAQSLVGFLAAISHLYIASNYHHILYECH